MAYVKQILIAVDQLVNAILLGYADETISARAYRLGKTSKAWRVAEKVINVLFFFQDEHCQAAYLDEVKNR